ncbi:MAG: 3D domain-containing protein, partial [Oscillospiraceae bacterium]
VVTKYAVMINDGDKQTLVFTSKSSPIEILEDEEIPLAKFDTFDYSGISQNKASIKINRAMPIKITADKKTTIVNLTNGTVSDALQKAKISVSQNDLINVAPTEPICKDMEIKINRVIEKDIKTVKEIPCEVIKLPTRTLKKGETKTLVAGVNGKIEEVSKQTIIDGEVVKTELVKKQKTKNPSTARILVGDPNAPVSQVIPSKPIELDKNKNPVSYKRKVVGKATAYSTFGRPTWLKPGYVAMDLSAYPRGTQVYIKTPNASYVYGYSLVKDTGPAVRSGEILVDLFFNSYEESCQFGAKQVEVYIL